MRLALEFLETIWCRHMVHSGKCSGLAQCQIRRAPNIERRYPDLSSAPFKIQRTIPVQRRSECARFCESADVFADGALTNLALVRLTKALIVVSLQRSLGHAAGHSEKRDVL